MDLPNPLISTPAVGELANAAEHVLSNAREAANDRVIQGGQVDPDGATAEADAERNPLWTVAAGMGCVLVVMAALLALG
jgi:hypothetical protein